MKQRKGRRNINWLSLFSLSNLPEHLLLEILYRLPVKSVFKFKSVSKYWFSLISDPLFARTYYSRKINIPITVSSANRNQPWTILYRYDGQPDSPDEVQVLKSLHPIFKSPSFTLGFFSNDFELPSTSLQVLLDDPSQDGKAPIILLAVSNGLLLSTATRFSHSCYYISNPFTKQYSALPRPLRIHFGVFVGLIAEPVDGSFQVVRIGGYKGSSDTLNIEIFSSKTGKWKDKTASFNLPVQIFTTRGMISPMYAVSCKKILYWMEVGEKLIAYDTHDDDTIQCHVIDLPGDQDIHNKVSSGMIGICQDNLIRYCHVPNIPQIQNLRVWELRNSKVDDWCFLYKIRMDEYNRSIPGKMRVLGLDAHDPDRLYFLHHTTSLFSALNLRTRVCKHLIVLKNVVNPKTVFQFVLPPWPTPVPRFS